MLGAVRSPGSSPHTRGARKFPEEETKDAGGSSPHTRGARVRERREHPARRIIPAYAGSTVSLLVSHFNPSDHPRIRGEHVFRRSPDGHGVGSSPHTRGAPSLKPGVSNGERIIPAYAGSTCRKPSSRRKIGDHPRIRGEHPPCPCPSERSWRIIPAYAGSTSRPRLSAPDCQDHPRIRGEHREHAVGEECRFGSSPHTRGALGLGSAGRIAEGIIPAYAGST